MNKKFVILGVILIATISVFFLWNEASKRATKSTSETKKAGLLPKEVTVALDKNGYSPNTVTIKAGSAVRWKNVSGEKQTVNSDNYPTNQLHRELNFGIFETGSSVVYIFKNSGKYGFHNQFHPEQKGEVIVTE